MQIIKDMTKVKEKIAYISYEEKNGLTQGVVKSLLEYKDGFLYWGKTTTNAVKIGDKASSISNDNGRFRYEISINDHTYKTARIIFLWHNGWSPECVDHIDRNPLNNKIENLRPATKAENNRNKSSHKNSSSQYLGVSWNTKRGYWVVQIRSHGKYRYIGYFTIETEAALAYNKAAVKYHKEFANLNIIKPQI